MADKKLNTGLSAEQVRLAFTRALYDMTDTAILAEIAKQVSAEKAERVENQTLLNGMISEMLADLAANYVNQTVFTQLKQRVDSLEERVTELEGDTCDT